MICTGGAGSEIDGTFESEVLIVVRSGAGSPSMIAARSMTNRTYLATTPVTTLQAQFLKHLGVAASLIPADTKAQLPAFIEAFQHGLAERLRTSN